MARILAKSRKNNARRKIVGGLLFGEGFFLQCLEGDAEAVDALYTTIESDRRHGDVTVLLRRPIEQRSFGAWSMKYVPGEAALSDLMRTWGATRFDPYSLSSDRIEAMVLYMQQEGDTAGTVPGELADPARHEPVPARAANNKERPRPEASARRSPALATRPWVGWATAQRMTWTLAFAGVGALVLYWATL